MTSPLSSAVERALSAHEAAPTVRSNAHLSDASFRFDAAAPTGPTPRPRPDAPGASWSLAQTLQELRIRGARVVRTTRGLRVLHAHRRPALADAVAAHAAQVGLWLDLGRPAPAHAWDDELAMQRAWLLARLGTPQMPLALRPGLSVTDWAQFVASVEGRYAVGPEAAGADGLRRDLGDLFEAYARTPAPAVRERRPARAA